MKTTRFQKKKKKKLTDWQHFHLKSKLLPASDYCSHNDERNKIITCMDHEQRKLLSFEQYIVQL